ncbi:hypothetical protein M0R72_08245 [Candidatus Pacearchaeota archaeon]|jgi:hypothetical protein|nr:hypothetical protein [Candidatus Pacearchaeota archaeon]
MDKKDANGINNLPTKEELKTAIIDFVSKRQGVSCVELSRAFGEGSHITEARLNVITAFGLSEELAKALVDLVNEGKLISIPSEFLVYVCDGAIPRWPLAKRDREYKKPHWLPVTYDTYEFGIAELKRLVKDKKVLKQILEDIERRRA